MPEHFHGFQWIGHSSSLDKSDGERQTADLAAFLSSSLPPFRMCDWLLRPQSQIKVTGDLETAVSWLREQWQQLSPNFAYPAYDEWLGGWDGRVQSAREALMDVGSMAWGHWLTGGRFGTTAVVGCPDRHAPDYRCPTG